MMLGPTPLTDIRHLLDRHGCGPPPWSPTRAPLDALLDTLGSRRHDDAFWRDAARLLERLDRRDVTRVRRADVLDGAAVDTLVAALRDALPEAPTSARRWAGSVSEVRVLAAFAMLTLAMACSSDDDDNANANDLTTGDDTQAVEERCDEAVQYSIPADEAWVYCDLVDIITDANISDRDRTVLLECLPSMDVSERDALLALLEQASEDELLQILSETSWESPCYEDSH